MEKGRLHRLLSRIVEIKPGEEAVVVLFFFYFFLITAPYGIIKSIRNAAFLDQVGSYQLPLAVLLTAAFAGFIVDFHSKLQARVERSVLIISSLIFFIVFACIFFALFPYNWNWLPYAYWIWANIFVIVLITQFWITVNDAFNPREVRRLIGFFGSGGILGGIAGSELSALLAKSNRSYGLLLLAAGFLAVCVLVVHSIQKRLRREREPVKADTVHGAGTGAVPRPGFKDSFDTVRKNSYLTTIAAVVAVTLIVSTLIDWQFNNIVEGHESVKHNMTSFFGHFNAALLGFSFLFQVLLTSRIIKSFGIFFSLLIYPVLLLFCSLGIAVLPVIHFAVGIKGTDKSLSYSLNQSIRELLYIPISPEVKYKAKVFIDMFINRASKGVGAVILMVLFAFRPGIQYVSLVSALFLSLWIALNLKVSREYVDTVKQKLKKRWERADRLVAERVDLDYTKLVFDTLESKNRSSVLYAMHLFDLIKREKLTPEVKRLLSGKSDELKISSLGAFFEAEDTILGPEMKDDLDESVLRKEVKEIMSLDVYQEVMKDYIDRTLRDEGRRTETARMEIAKALGMMDSRSPLVENLENLLDDPSPEVNRYAMESAAVLRRKDLLPLLVNKLRSPVLREDTVLALEKFGSRITGTLADYLGDREEDLEVRKSVASILAKIGTQEAADFLSWQLAVDKGDMGPELVDALDKIRSEKKDVGFSEAVIEAKIFEEIERYCEIFLLALEPGLKEEFDQRRGLLERERGASLMSIFRLLGLIYAREDMVKAYQNIRGKTRESVAYALELLDNSLKRDMKEALFPLVEDISFEERARRFRQTLKFLQEPRS